jgi:hypothetical protein
MSQTEWKKQAQQLGLAHKAVPWSIGDLIVEGSITYGEKIWQHMDAFGLPENLLKDYAYIAGKYPKGCEARKFAPKLTLYHFRELAGLSEEQALGLLKMAADMGWSTKRLRREKQEVS